MDADEPEWSPESNISFRGHVIAGSIAGLAEHTIMFPIDTLKTHVQCSTCQSSSWSCAVKMIKREGFLRLWRGVSASFVGCIPAHAAYFSVYEQVKVLVGADKSGHHPFQAAIAGASAAFVHDLVMTPLDTVKQRMQLGYYQNIKHCLETIVKEEGIRAFYVSLPTTVLMNLPYGCVMVATNESMKKVINPSEKYSLWASMISGGVAGSVAAALTNPLDVIKTRLQTQSLEPCPLNSPSLVPVLKPRHSISPPSGKKTSPTPSSSSSSHLSHGIPLTSSRAFSSIPQRQWQLVTDIVKQEGVAGLLRGIGPRMIVHAPSVAISWSVYEGIKSVIASESP